MRNSRQLQYKTVNAYTHKPAYEQILTIFLFVAVTVIHNVFVTASFPYQNLPILWILLAVTYACFVAIFYDYCYLTCTDPVDDLVIGVKKQGLRSEDLQHCKQCALMVSKSSFHCHTCDRCVSNFDHHCKYLNNCIGGKNYHNFIRLLINVTLYCLTIIGQGIWIFILANQDQNFNNNIISKWGVLASIILTFVVMVTVDTLLCFHFYLIFVLGKSTLQFIDDRQKQPADSSNDHIRN